MFPCVVKFGNKYAVRRYSLFGREYLDGVSPWYWWSKSDRYFSDCFFNSEEDAVECYKKYKNRNKSNIVRWL